MYLDKYLINYEKKQKKYPFIGFFCFVSDYWYKIVTFSPENSIDKTENHFTRSYLYFTQIAQKTVNYFHAFTLA